MPNVVLKGMDYKVTEDPEGGFLLDLGLEGGPESHMDMVSVGRRLSELGIRHDLKNPPRKPLHPVWWYSCKVALWVSYWTTYVLSTVLRALANVAYDLSVHLGAWDAVLERKFYLHTRERPERVTHGPPRVRRRIPKAVRH